MKKNKLKFSSTSNLSTYYIILEIKLKGLSTIIFLGDINQFIIYFFISLYFYSYKIL